MGAEAEPVTLSEADLSYTQPLLRTDKAWRRGKKGNV